MIHWFLENGQYGMSDIDFDDHTAIVDKFSDMAETVFLMTRSTVFKVAIIKFSCDPKPKSKILVFQDRKHDIAIEY